MSTSPVEIYVDFEEHVCITSLRIMEHRHHVLPKKTRRTDSERKNFLQAERVEHPGPPPRPHSGPPDERAASKNIFYIYIHTARQDVVVPNVLIHVASITKITDTWQEQKTTTTSLNKTTFTISQESQNLPGVRYASTKKREF